MANNAKEYTDFASVKERLDEIVDAVSNDELPLDEALDLYEEAVALGMRASDLLEEGIALETEASEEEQPATDGAAGAQTSEEAMTAQESLAR